MPHLFDPRLFNKGWPNHNKCRDKMAGERSDFSRGDTFLGSIFDEFMVDLKLILWFNLGVIFNCFWGPNYKIGGSNGEPVVQGRICTDMYYLKHERNRLRKYGT